MKELPHLLNITTTLTPSEQRFRTTYQMNIVWFKRDLRLEDNESFLEASRSGPVLPIYIIERQLWLQPDLTGRQYNFLKQCLDELDQSLRNYGGKLIIKVGDAVQILAELKEKHSFDKLYSHQETWNGWTFLRDVEVRAWAKKNDVHWIEKTQHGVIRALSSRNGWSANWYSSMNKPEFQKPTRIIFVNEHTDPIPANCELKLDDDELYRAPRGGRKEAKKLLDSFLNSRGEKYRSEMSSPLTAIDSCSRLSPHIAFGTISVKEIYQATIDRIQNLRHTSTDLKKDWSRSLKSFSSRLRWHCHFIQKLESEPEIEFKNMNSCYNGLREDCFNPTYFEAWKSGHTGYPMIDACMRFLTATGWLNFRMRALLISFSSQHLWLHWREPSVHLAGLFTDYEPGIHYSQTQMQSGTTGINTIRIYNPIKQGLDQDPKGTFVRQWVPELKDIDHDFIHTPWLSPNKPKGYPAPIVDEKTSRQAASKMLYAVKGKPEHKEIAREVYVKHGSRKGKQTTRRTRISPKNRLQGELNF